jgi:hypothetical protein
MTYVRNIHTRSSLALQNSNFNLRLIHTDRRKVMFVYVMQIANLVILVATFQRQNRCHCHS